MSTEERLERIERLMVISMKNVLTVADAALMIGISESRVRHLTSERSLPFYKNGKSTYFKKSEIEDWMLKKRIPSKAEIDSIASTYCTINKPML